MRTVQCLLFRAMSGAFLALASLATTASAQNGRIEISQASLNPPASNRAYEIRLPGSYVLTESLVITNNQRGIQISATNVTLDLNGFSLTGPTNISQSGIYASTLTRGIVVKNGCVRNWGSGGLFIGGPASRIQNMTVENCGSSLSAGRVIIVRDCVINPPTNAPTSSSGMYCGGLILNCSIRNQSPNVYVYGMQNQEPSLVADCLIEGGDYGIYSLGVAYVRDNDIIRATSSALSGNTYNPASGTRMDGNRASKSINSVYNPLGTNIAIRNQTADSIGDTVARCFGPNVAGTGTMTNTSPWANIRY